VAEQAPAVRYRELWADELAGAALYRALADRTTDPARRDVFASLAEAEARHAEHWLHKLHEAGVHPSKPPRLPLRVRVLTRLVRWFGADPVLPLVLRAEAADATKYRGVADAPRGMAEQEAVHGRVVAAMSGGDTTGGRIAAAEGRHRAGAGGALRASVFGVQDGLVSNLALVMGFAGGTSDRGVVLVAGLLGIVAGALSMATGEWNSVLSQRELYENEIRIEREELREFPAEEAEELELIYQAKGIHPDEAHAIVERIMRRPDVALDTLAREELGLDPGSLGSPWVAAGASFFAFAVGAFVPLIAFLFGAGATATITSVVISVATLGVVGVVVSVFTGGRPVRNAVRMIVIGGLVAGTTFAIGSLVGVSVS
jgi:VIT1/CCC1 family predicted Fe2+/Mn2+ transporter